MTLIWKFLRPLNYSLTVSLKETHMQLAVRKQMQVTKKKMMTAVRVGRECNVPSNEYYQ